MQAGCYSLGLAAAAGLAAAELGAALGAPALLLTAARLLLLCVWLRCWSTASRASGSPTQPCGGGGAAPRAAEAKGVAGASLTTCAQGGSARRQVWRSAGVPLPAPELAMNLIKSRRSVFCRDMLPGRPLDPAALRLLLEAASWAPSHGCTEPWHFVVFDSPSGLQELTAVSVAVIQREEGPEAAAVAEQEFEPGRRWANAACLVAICMRRRPRCCNGGAPRHNPEWEEVAAVACAVQNLHLMATALPGAVCGYWSSWYESVRDAPEMRHLLGLEDDDRCLGFFVLGHSMRAGAYRASRAVPSVDWR